MFRPPIPNPRFPIFVFPFQTNEKGGIFYMNLKKIRNILCIAVLLIAAAGTNVLFANPRFGEPVVKYNEAQAIFESGD